MNVTTMDQDKELADLLAAQGSVPADAEAAKARLAEAREAFASARRGFHSASARASLGQASKAEVGAAERALDKAVDELRKAEDEVEILDEKVSILATAIADTRARRRASVLPQVKAEGERIAAEAAEAFQQLARLASEARALSAVVVDHYVVDVTIHGRDVYAKEIKQLGAVPAVAAFLASRKFADLLERWAAAS